MALKQCRDCSLFLILIKFDLIFYYDLYVNIVKISTFGSIFKIFLGAP